MKYRTFLNSKIHRATVTSADIDYVGSITIDRALLKAAGINVYELVHVTSVTNGARLETYVIPAPEGSGIIQMNGSAAHLIGKGHKIIIMAYTMVEEPLPESWTPKVILVDENNKITEIREITEHFEQ